MYNQFNIHSDEKRINNNTNKYNNNNNNYTNKIGKKRQSEYSKPQQNE